MKIYCDRENYYTRYWSFGCWRGTLHRQRSLELSSQYKNGLSNFCSLKLSNITQLIRDIWSSCRISKYWNAFHIETRRMTTSPLFFYDEIRKSNSSLRQRRRKKILRRLQRREMTHVLSGRWDITNFDWKLKKLRKDARKANSQIIDLASHEGHQELISVPKNREESPRQVSIRFWRWIE